MKVTVILDTPIKRGDQEITEVTIRKPIGGELRGTNLTDIIQLDVVALARVLPRISTPTLTEPDINRMDPADLFQLGQQVAGFLLPKSVKVDTDSPAE